MDDNPQTPYGIEAAPENPKERIKGDEIAIASPEAKGVSRESSESYQANISMFLSNGFKLFENGKRLWEAGDKLYRVYSKKPTKELLSDLLPALAGVSFAPNAAAVPTLGAVAPKATAVGGASAGPTSRAIASGTLAAGGGPLVFVQGMLVLISIQLSDIQSQLSDISEQIFMQSVNELKGALGSARNAILAEAKAGYKGFQNSAYVDLNTKFNTLCEEVNSKIDSTNPEDENMFKHIFGAGKAVKACGSLERGVHALVDTIAVSSDLCSRISPAVAYNDQISNLEALAKVKFGRLSEILRYVDDDQFSDFESSVKRLPKTIKSLIDSKDKKPVLLVSGNELTKLMEKQNG